MKIVTSEKIKTKVILSCALFSILGALSVCSIVVSGKLAVNTASVLTKSQTVIIDAGHGGMDGGTSAADGTLEKDINLSISLKLDEILRSMGINTVMTRSQDISIHDENAQTVRQKKVSDIKNRLKILNETDNSIFVSIHQNHFSDSKYSGAQVFYSKNNPLSSKLAEKIRLPIITYLQADNTRETKSVGTDIYLLYHADSPAVMVECGFLSNKDEANNLKDEKYQQKIAFLIALGIVDYFKETEEL